ncbi:MAG: hypothetical protein ABJB34_10775, partial [Acidobacteriota bacterium]
MRRVVSSILIIVFLSLFASSALPQKSISSKLALPTDRTNSDKPTSFENVFAYSDGKAVWLEWQMAVEVGNIGFNVYRTDTDGTQLLTDVRMVPGAATHGRGIPQYGATYNFLDQFADGTSTYYVETLSLKGEKV